MFRAIRRTCDVRHHDAGRGRAVDDLEDLLGLGGGGDAGKDGELGDDFWNCRHQCVLVRARDGDMVVPVQGRLGRCIMDVRRCAGAGCRRDVDGPDGLAVMTRDGRGGVVEVDSSG